jgi:hypothetical protein
MQTKDYWTIGIACLALILSLTNLVVSFFREKRSRTLEAATRRNDVMMEFLNVELVLSEILQYCTLLAVSPAASTFQNDLREMVHGSIGLIGDAKQARESVGQFDAEIIGKNKEERLRLEAIAGSAALQKTIANDLLVQAKRMYEETKK